MEKLIILQEWMIQLLEKCYDYAIDGLSRTKSCKQCNDNMLKKLPSAIQTKINQKVGYQILTKLGEKGAVNLVKVVPVAGGIIGG